MKDTIRIGITGCTGALGRRLTEIAVEKGFAVKCLVRSRQKAEPLKALGVDISYGDICDKESLAEFTRDLDVCIHLAALVGHGSREEYRKVNEIGTDNVCTAILENNPGCRLIHCSSISALKVPQRWKFLSTDYGRSKLAADKRVERHVLTGNLKAATIYPGLIYGPYDTHFVPVLINYLKQNRVFLVTGGEIKGPVIYIDDLCELFLSAAENEESIGKKYLGVGSLEIGIHDFIRMLAEKMNCSLPKVVLPKMLLTPLALLSELSYGLLGIRTPPLLSKRIVGFFSISFRIDTDRFCRNLGWSPMVTPSEGIERALRWQREHPGC